MFLCKTQLIFQLQEYEIENAKLKEDLRKLRQSIADGYGKDSQIKEIMGKTDTQLCCALPQYWFSNDGLVQNPTLPNSMICKFRF